MKPITGSMQGISLYMALFECCNKNGFENPVAINRHFPMAMAKISGIATYHRSMKDLYRRSFKFLIYKGMEAQFPDG